MSEVEESELAASDLFRILMNEDVNQLVQSKRFEEAVRRGYVLIMSIDQYVTAEGLERDVIGIEDSCGRIVGVKE